MKTATDFDAWISANIDTQQDKEELLSSVTEVSDAGVFSTEKRGDQFFVKGTNDGVLCLDDEEARQLFLARVRKAEVSDELEEGFERNMNNPNA